ncbi:hypothetical protein Tco_0450472 [Tanacetum coccineum]
MSVVDFALVETMLFVCLWQLHRHDDNVNTILLGIDCLFLMIDVTNVADPTPALDYVVSGLDVVVLFSDPGDDFYLKDMEKALLLDKKSQAPTPVKAVEESCVTCGGAHSYRNFPATNGNIYRDNIQEYVSQAAATN